MSSGERTREASRDPWVWVAFLLPASAVLVSLMQTEDLAYQVRAGDLMWRLHEVLRTDPFTFTMAEAPWHDQQWGAQPLLAAIHGVGEWRALVVVRAAIVGGAVGVTYLRTRVGEHRRRPPRFLTFAPFLVCMTLPGHAGDASAAACRSRCSRSLRSCCPSGRERPRALSVHPGRRHPLGESPRSFVLLPLCVSWASWGTSSSDEARHWATGALFGLSRAGTRRDSLALCRLPPSYVYRLSTSTGGANGDRRVAADLAAASRPGSSSRSHASGSSSSPRARQPSHASRRGLAHARTVYDTCRR